MREENVVITVHGNLTGGGSSHCFYLTSGATFVEDLSKSVV